jgi:hypothetical protein
MIMRGIFLLSESKRRGQAAISGMMQFSNCRIPDRIVRDATKEWNWDFAVKPAG